MKKKRLDTVYDYDFELIGLISSAKSHKIAWELSGILEIRLTRQPDLAIQVDEKHVDNYPYFTAGNELHKIRLFKNHAQVIGTSRIKKYLVPEHAYLDYIFMSQGVNRPDPDHIRKHLERALSVEMLIFIPLNTLRSKEFFIF